MRMRVNTSYIDEKRVNSNNFLWALYNKLPENWNQLYVLCGVIYHY
jgi:hypothetical protein